MAVKSMRTRFVEFIDEAIKRSKLSDEFIAIDLGYPKSSIIGLFRSGTMRVPIEKVRRLGSALNVNERELLTLWLQDYMPELIQAFEEAGCVPLRPNEGLWLHILRRAFPNGAPVPDDATERALMSVLRA